ncbi:MAG: [FeFe] hydrogenase H-cluster maturation GTPase HydF [Syntrophorhabdaceae bacterium]|nr:[FeFe] hydrogenase H-cluster maturation GTPase HydF [Syntrophorhabdaceae bacterium]
MSLDSTPKGQRLHIAIFGRRNAGKSSLINALTGQDIAIVSDLPGTTTDPVAKAMEILPIGPVMLIDTAGLDDTGYLGNLRVKKTIEVFSKTDLVLLVIDPEKGFDRLEEEIIERARSSQIPVISVINKIDLYPDIKEKEKLTEPWVAVSAKTGQGIDTLKGMIVRNAPKDWSLPTVVGDLISPGDTAILVIPIDKAAPKGRLILPQQQVIRDILEHDGISVMVKERELRLVIDRMVTKPRIVITDASAYLKAVADTPPDVLFTSFSILFARYKGDLNTLAAGVAATKGLKAGDKVLIAEACTHHPVADDIGRVKIPRWLRQNVGGELDFHVVSGGGKLPDNITDYNLIVHCGACMLNRREMMSRIIQAKEAGVPIVNYGVLMAHIHGVLKRALSPFPHTLSLLKRLLQEEEDDLFPGLFKEVPSEP